MPERRLSRLLKAKLLRRSSTPAVPKTGNGADPPVLPNPTPSDSRPLHLFDSASEKSPYSVVSSADHSSDETGPTSEPDRHEGHAPKSKSKSRSRRHERHDCNSSTLPSGQEHQRCHLPHAPERSTSSPLPTDPEIPLLYTPLTDELPSPLESPLATPQHSDDTSFQSAVVKVRPPAPTELQLTPTLNTVAERTATDRRPSSSAFPPQSSKRPSIAIRRQSLLPASHQNLISGLLEQSLFSGLNDPQTAYAPVVADEMVQRRIWVKRPGGSATLVPCLEDALVDELRDQVIMKFANSLGRTWDPPDIVIRIAPREGSNRQTTPERLLSPEETLSSILDTYYPGGQKIEEALLIDAPTRRTPKPSPRHSVYHHHNPEPGEHGEYFPLMPAKVPTPPTHPAAAGPSTAPAISILSTGVAPPLPSPGRGASRHHRRPPLQRHTTNSPTILGQGPIVSVTGMSLRITFRPAHRSIDD
jgi:osomolarity two-component system response regulator SSK1